MGLLALLGCLGLAILAGILFSRTSSCTCYGQIPLIFFIVSILAVIVAIISIYVCYSSKKSVENNEEPNHLMIAILLIISLALFAFFLIGAIYMFMYRPFHYGDVIKSRED